MEVVTHPVKASGRTTRIATDSGALSLTALLRSPAWISRCVGTLAGYAMDAFEKYRGRHGKKSKLSFPYGARARSVFAWQRSFGTPEHPTQHDRSGAEPRKKFVLCGTWTLTLRVGRSGEAGLTSATEGTSPCDTAHAHGALWRTRTHRSMLEECVEVVRFSLGVSNSASIL